MELTDQITQTVRALPVERQAEVLDFVEFLALRSNLAAGPRTLHPAAEANEQLQSQWSLEQAIADDVDDPVGYSLADCAEVWL